MRSTRDKTRAARAQFKQHYTAAKHASVPAASNTPAESRKGQGRLNTNTPLAKGGISSYYKAREGWGQ